ncbi:MAG TPA: hypothetical protein VFK82_00145 [Burkholderiaceae bacterium]|nr:hypothetical protein [Burkholderiaceae bacterium]
MRFARFIICLLMVAVPLKGMAAVGAWACGSLRGAALAMTMPHGSALATPAGQTPCPDHDHGSAHHKADPAAEAQASSLKASQDKAPCSQCAPCCAPAAGPPPPLVPAAIRLHGEAFSPAPAVVHAAAIKPLLHPPKTAVLA